MNFLAHIYLSGESEQILVGNFIGDAVKGRNYGNFPVLVQKGISLHRFIDYFTDTHPFVQRSKSLLNSHYHKYSGIIVDIFYDHFLSRSWNMFSDVPLREFIYNTYEILIRNSDLFPNEVKRYFPFFVLNNWLETYTCVSGIESVLQRMTVRTSLPDYTDFAIETMLKEYASFEEQFLEFFPELIEAVQEKYKIELPDFEAPKQYLPSA